jgi:hypothetical protein
MSFSDDARKFAQQKQTEKQKAAEEAARDSERRIQVEIEQRESRCISELEQWFDGVGMQPYPVLSIGRRSWHSGLWPTLGEDAGEYRFDIAWEFEGYAYKSSYTDPGPTSPWVYIRVNYQWHQANDKEQIGHALLQERS